MAMEVFTFGTKRSLSEKEMTLSMAERRDDAQLTVRKQATVVADLLMQDEDHHLGQDQTMLTDSSGGM